MIKGTGIVRRLNKEDAEAVYAVRQEAYESSAQFKVLNYSYLEWNEVDDIAIVLGVSDDSGELLASLRGEFIRTRQEAEAKLHYAIDPKLDLFPGILLGRGATKRAYRNYGFNSLLRYYYLGLAIDFPFKSIFASVFEKAPRVGLLRDMNYRFTIPGKSTDDDIQVITREYFVYLERKHFLPSFKFLQTKFGDVIGRYPWTGLI